MNLYFCEDFQNLKFMSETENYGKAWEGGDKPYVASYGKLMMWFFLIIFFININNMLLKRMAIVEHINQLGTSGNCILSTKIIDVNPAKNIQILPIPIHKSCRVASLFLKSIMGLSMLIFSFF